MKAWKDVTAPLLRLAALALAMLCALPSLLSQGGRFSLALDVFSHFTLVYLAAGLAALALWAACDRRGKATPILAVTGLASCLILTTPEWLARPDPISSAPPSAPTLKLVQFNIWKQNRDPDATLAWIEQQKADLVTIEDSSDLGSPIVEALAPLYPYSADLGDSHIFSKLPITASRQVKSGSSVLAQVSLPDGGEADIAAVHISWPLFVGVQAWQRQRLINDLGALPKDDLIIAGDFNLTPWSAALKQLDRGFGVRRLTHGQPSWPATISWLPAFMPIDQVFAGSHWRLITLRRGPRLGSDHRPLVLTLQHSP